MFLSAFVICGFIATIVLSIEIGYRIGLRFSRAVPESAGNASAAIVGSVFGLMALLLAFTFYGAASRFDNRRILMVEEANVIGTAYLRLDLLPPEAQPRLREDFRKYLRSRITTFKKVPDIQATRLELARSQ